MNLQEYKQIYFDFEVAVSCTRLIAVLSAKSLRGFPKNLPPDWKEVIAKTFREWGNALTLAADTAASTGSASVVFSMADSDMQFLEPAANIVKAGSFGSNTTRVVESLPFAQELAMLVAHLDALMSDCLKAACRVEPRLLHRTKKMNWETILEIGHWEGVITKMIEDYAYEFGWKSTKEKVQYLLSEHGLAITTPQAKLDSIDEAESIRHLVVHNGSRVSQEYLDRTGRTDLSVGDIIPIDEQYAGKVHSSILDLGSDVFLAIGTKYFHASREEFTGVRRPQAG